MSPHAQHEVDDKVHMLSLTVQCVATGFPLFAGL